MKAPPISKAAAIATDDRDKGDALERAITQIERTLTQIHAGLIALGLEQCDHCGGYIKANPDDEAATFRLIFDGGEAHLCATCVAAWARAAEDNDNFTADDWVQIRDTLNRWLRGDGHKAQIEPTDRSYLTALAD
jgi:hypothetical protein